MRRRDALVCLSEVNIGISMKACRQDVLPAFESGDIVSLHAESVKRTSSAGDPGNETYRCVHMALEAHQWSAHV